jgi:hypothetical protein
MYGDMPPFCRAIAQAFSRWLPTTAARVQTRVWSSGICDGQSTSVSPANLHSTKFSIIIITRGRYNSPISGRRAEWTQLDSTPHYANLKKYKSHCRMVAFLLRILEISGSNFILEIDYPD